LQSEGRVYAAAKISVVRRFLRREDFFRFVQAAGD
jgi:hypothetical protein